MDKYNIVYTNAAANDIAEKFQYITSVLHDRTTAERWYARLKDAIWHDLSFMPEKYPLYNEEPWHSKGVHLFITRQDVVVYSTDKTAQTVYNRRRTRKVTSPLHHFSADFEQRLAKC